MSKNSQRNAAEFNLGAETYARGYGDGVAGRPKTIKKTHRHAHRYHIGYRHGADEAKRNMQGSQSQPFQVIDEAGVAQTHFKLPVRDKPGFWSRALLWLKS